MKSIHYPCSLIVAGALLGALLLSASQVYGQPANIRYAKQGFSMRACLSNQGVVGRAAYPNGMSNLPPDSIGLEYPIGQPYEHVFGAGLWVGGKLDTAQSGTSTPIRLVTTGYEGWAGPYFEFFPGSSPADSIWKVTGRGMPRPQNWSTYWGNLIPAVSFSDNDHYCLYDDARVRVTGHIALKLKVVQCSYVWNDPIAEAVHIIEYKIFNMGAKQIDSAYVGMFNDGDVGPYSVVNYFQQNCAGYYAESRAAFIHNPVDLGSTPVGVAALYASRPLDSLRHSFQWWRGESDPSNDNFKYQRLSSGRIDSNQSLADLSETRCLISFGPFTLHSPGGPVHDTVVVAFAIVSGQNLTMLRQHADRAKLIYLNGGQVSVSRGRVAMPEYAELRQNYPNPFNPTTTIRFSIPKSGYVKVAVFNILGEEISSLIAGELPVGTHEVRWDATGRPSGIYFYRLESPWLVETRRLVLLR